MILKAEPIAGELKNPTNTKDPLVITPMPNLKAPQQLGAASVDIRLGCWFLSCRQFQIPFLNMYETTDDVPNEAKLTKTHYVPFGEAFILHPKAFVLGVTLEWIRLPVDRAAYVVGRSSWGRHGLIIATATGVHPGFTGCLTLELTNVGKIPIVVKPGTTICRLFIHEVKVGEPDTVDQSSFVGRRKPTLGANLLDKTARLLGSEISQ